MIYDYLFSADDRQPGSKAWQEADKVDVGTLLFNHENPGFAFMLKAMRLVNNSLN